MFRESNSICDSPATAEAYGVGCVPISIAPFLMSRGTASFLPAAPVAH